LKKVLAALNQHSYGKTKGNQENPQSGYAVGWLNLCTGSFCNIGLGQYHYINSLMVFVFKEDSDMDHLCPVCLHEPTRQKLERISQYILNMKILNPSGHQCTKYTQAKIPILPLLIP
jgi:hypothetical protein